MNAPAPVVGTRIGRYEVVALAPRAWSARLALPPTDPVEIRAALHRTALALHWPVTVLLALDPAGRVREVLFTRDPSLRHGTPAVGLCEQAATHLRAATGWNTTGRPGHGLLVPLGLRCGYQATATVHPTALAPSQIHPTRWGKLRDLLGTDPRRAETATRAVSPPEPNWKLLQRPTGQQPSLHPCHVAAEVADPHRPARRQVWRAAHRRPRQPRHPPLTSRDNPRKDPVMVTAAELRAALTALRNADATNRTAARSRALTLGAQTALTIADKKDREDFVASYEADIDDAAG